MIGRYNRLIEDAIEFLIYINTFLLTNQQDRQYIDQTSIIQIDYCSLPVGKDYTIVKVDNQFADAEYVCLLKDQSVDSRLQK